MRFLKSELHTISIGQTHQDSVKDLACGASCLISLACSAFCFIKNLKIMWLSSRVVVCCSVLQCDVVCCSVLQCVAVYCSVLQRAAVCCIVW